METDPCPFDSAQLNAARDVLLDFELQAASGAPVDFEELCSRRPELADVLRFLSEEAERPHFPRRSDELSLAERLQRHLGHDYAPRATLSSDGAPRSEPTPSGRYRVLEEIGRGGMGVVFKVWDADLRRHLAVKVSRAKPFSSNRLTTHEKQRLARFLDEAQITSQLEHPGIVPVHDVGIDEEGRVYFTMRLVRGRDLTEIFERSWNADPETPVSRVIETLIDLCDTLEYAHDKGVVHRDLKPSNVMVGRFGAVYVMDWGVARVVGREKRPMPQLKRESAVTEVHTTRHDDKSSSTDSSLQTMEGDIVGTPAYMAPEQAAGRIDELSTRSDIYSVGAMLYHFLARHRPYVASHARVNVIAMQMRILEGPPRRLLEIRPDLPAELVAICERAMERDPERRYASARDLGRDLRAYIGGRVVQAFEAGAWAELRKWIGRNRAFAATAASLLLLCSIAPIVVYSRELRAASAELNREVAERNYEDAKSSMFALLGIAMQSSADGENDQRVAVALERALGGLRYVASTDQHLAFELARTTIDSCRRVGRSVEAEALANGIIELARASWGEDDVRIRSMRSTLCAIYNMSGRYADAAPLARGLIEACHRTRDAVMERQARAHLLAALVGSQAGHAEAIDELERNPDGFKIAVGGDASIGELELLAGSLSAERKCASIAALIDEVRRQRGLESTFGLRLWLVQCIERDDAEHAIALQEELVRDMDRTLPPLHVRLIHGESRLAALLARSERLEDALEHWRRAVERAIELPSTAAADRDRVLDLAIAFAFEHSYWSQAADWSDAHARAPSDDDALVERRKTRAAEALTRRRVAGE